MFPTPKIENKKDFDENQKAVGKLKIGPIRYQY